MTCSSLAVLPLIAQNVPANFRKLALAAGMVLGLSAAVAASVTVDAPPASASARFVDHGGRVLSAAHVYPIYWGRHWAPGRSASPTPDEITHALRTVLAGSYQAGLAQYRTIGPATIRASRVITTSDPPSGFTDKNTEAFLDAQFDAGVLPAPDDQAIYVVTIPPGIYTSGDDLVGEHNYYERDGHRIHYVWTTDSEVLDGATQTTTHEIIESLTDPEGTAILGTPGTCDGERWCEIADICSDPDKLHGVMVAPYWSNIAGHCVIPAPPALAASEDRTSGHAASQAQPRLAFPQDAIAPHGRTNERRRRAARRRPRMRRVPSAGSGPLTSQEVR